MANTLFTPEQVAAVAIRLLRDDLVIANTFNRKYESDFGGGKGSSVDVRVPATLKARRRTIGATGAITLDNVTESTVSVALTDMTYSAVPVTDEDMSLDLEDFARQILGPQVTAVAEDIENLAIETMQAVTETNGTGIVPAYDATNPGKQFTTARKLLRDGGVPASGLFAACGTQVYADLVESGQLTDVSASGSSEALLNANVKRMRGFDVIECNRLDDDEIVFYHGDAFTIAVLAPVVPQGVAFGQSVSSANGALRWVRDYDSSLLQDRSIVSAFMGAKSMTMKHLKADGTTENFLPAIRIKTTTAPA